MEMRYLNLTTTDPAMNLAVEQYVFDRLPRDCAYFLLWQNDNAVVIGKYQNAYAEIDQQYVNENGIAVVRRLSGGGAVYHDLGNLNYTLITDAENPESLDLSFYCQPVIRALRSLGIPAEGNSRNDITIEGKKISGNSQYLKNGRVMHHGTLLFDSNLSVLTSALKVDPDKLKAKGTKSVRSRVTNILPYLPTPITMQAFRKEILNAMIESTSASELLLTQKDYTEIKRIRDERYQTWEWNYGKSPECSIRRKQRYDGVGTVEALIDLENGRIQAVRFLGDFFSLRDPDELSDVLRGCRMDYASILSALQEADVSAHIHGLRKEQLADLLADT